MSNLRIDIDQRANLINCILVSLLNSDQVIVFSIPNKFVSKCNMAFIGHLKPFVFYCCTVKK